MNILESFPFLIKPDLTGCIFAFAAIAVFVCNFSYSFYYMKGEKHNRLFMLCFILATLAETGLCMAGNIFTFYMFYELLTITSMPLVLTERTKEAIMAACKYLFFSMCGAYMALFGIFILVNKGGSGTFVPGGIITADIYEANPSLILFACFMIIIGFGVKAGLCPLHSWLPTAHPVAPAPASAAMSAAIVKASVLGIIRGLYYLAGIRVIRETAVQNIFIILTLITVFVGSLLAYREPVLKKRLAYSTVSQLSYILFGLAIINEDGFAGSILHVLSHAAIKAVLFMTAGVIIHTTGKTKVSDMKGVGLRTPLIMWCFTICALGLIGIPPTSGFISKWYLAKGALEGSFPVVRFLGPAVLLISALLTAGYLLPIAINGFMPGESADRSEYQRAHIPPTATIPIVILTLVSLVLGIFPGKLLELINTITANIF